MSLEQDFPNLSALSSHIVVLLLVSFCDKMTLVATSDLMMSQQMEKNITIYPKESHGISSALICSHANPRPSTRAKRMRCAKWPKPRSYAPLLQHRNLCF